MKETYTISYQNVTGMQIRQAKLPKTYQVDQEIVLPKPTRPGYIFDGWYTNEKLSSVTVSK